MRILVPPRAAQFYIRNAAVSHHIPQRNLLKHNFLRTLATDTARKSGSTVTADDSLIFPPDSTLPPPLVLPSARKENESTISHYFKVGKGYLSFYKTGLKAVYRNFKAARPIQERADNEGGHTLTGLVEQGKLTRAELQLIMRARHDNRRIPIFALLFIVCGEFTPFVVVFCSSIVPYTCRIPKEITSDREKIEKRRHDALSSPPPLPPPPTAELPTSSPDPASSSTAIPPPPDLKNLSRPQLFHISNCLGLHSTMWTPSFLPTTAASFLPPTALLRRRIRKHLEYLNLDDILLERYGGAEAIVTHATSAAGKKASLAKKEMEKKEGNAEGQVDPVEREIWRRRQELEMAASERAIDTLNRPETEIIKDLRKWFDLRKKTGGDVLKAFWGL